MHCLVLRAAHTDRNPPARFIARAIGHLLCLQKWGVMHFLRDRAVQAFDHDLFGHVLPNFRQQFARAIRFRYIVIAAGHSRILSFTAEMRRVAS